MLLKQLKVFFCLFILISTVQFAGCRNIPYSEDDSSGGSGGNSGSTNGNSTASIVSAVADNGIITIKHKWSAGDQDKIDVVECQRKADNASSFVTYQPGKIEATSCTDKTPDVGHQVYRLHVVYTDGTSIYSNETDPVVAILSVPGSLLVVDTGSVDHVTWSYDASYTADEIAGYEIKYQLSDLVYQNGGQPKPNIYFTKSVSPVATHFLDIDPCTVAGYDHVRFQITAIGATCIINSAASAWYSVSCP